MKQIPSLKCCLYLFVFILLPPLVSSCGSSGSSSDTSTTTTETTEAKLAEVNDLLEQSRYNEAVTLLNDVVISDPYNTEVMQARAAAYFGRAGISTNQFTDALVLPDDVSELTTIDMAGTASGIYSRVYYTSREKFLFQLADLEKSLRLMRESLAGETIDFSEEELTQRSTDRAQAGQMASLALANCAGYILSGRDTETMTDLEIAEAFAERFEEVEDMLRLSLAVFKENLPDMLSGLVSDPADTERMIVQLLNGAETEQDFLALLQLANDPAVSDQEEDLP